MAKEKFAQIGFLEVTETGANTLTYAGLSVFSNVLGQKGMVLHKVAYSPTAGSYAVLTTASDRMQFGLCGSNTPTAPDYENAEFYDIQNITLSSQGAPATGHLTKDPFYTDFTGLPGGGMLVPADRLFVFIMGANLGGAVAMNVRFWYTVMDLSAQDYLELAQSMRVLR